MIYFTLVSTGSLSASALVGLSNTCTRRLSYTQPRNLLDCLQPTVLLSQQRHRVVEISHWDERLKKCDAYFSWSKKASSSGSV